MNVPTGWKLVPIAPTQEMMDADFLMYTVPSGLNYAGNRRNMWGAMLAAAPAAVAQAAVPEVQRYSPNPLWVECFDSEEERDFYAGLDESKNRPMNQDKNGDYVKYQDHAAAVVQAEPSEAPVARLQADISDRPFTKGESLFDVVILDRERCVDDMLLYAQPSAQDKLSELRAALEMAVRQNSHDMLMTGAEIRRCEAVLRGVK